MGADAVTAADATYRSGSAAEAFQRLAPVTPDYALCPIDEGFNWTDALADLDAGQWYLVVFRSVRSSAADVEMLSEYDDHAYQEALAASGLLYYFRGTLSPTRACLSFCVWESQRQAQQASALPLHRAAMRIVAQMYDSYQLERYIVTKRSGKREPQIVPLPDWLMPDAADLPTPPA
jgi:hypothetical protein